MRISISGCLQTSTRHFSTGYPLLLWGSRIEIFLHHPSYEIRDISLLQSAVARPEAAALMHSIIKNHPSYHQPQYFSSAMAFGLPRPTENSNGSPWTSHPKMLN